MAQTDHTVTPDKGPASDRLPWVASFNNNDVDSTGNLIVKADPSSGNLYLKHVIVFADADCVSWTLNDLTTAILGPIELTATEMSHYTDITFVHPIKLTNSLNIDANTNGVINVLAEGYTA